MSASPTAVHDPEVQKVMAFLKVKCEGPEPEDHKLTAINWASLWTLVQQYGPAIIQFIITQLPAGTAPDKIGSVVLATLNKMKEEGLIGA